ncbi:MAG: DUF1456 family protein [Spirochaetes bacterium]|nr:DUF1456 family protein [Spirochaetota bacterium]
MINNDILIRLRYALNITDLKLVEIFALAGKPMSAEEIRLLFLREGEEGFRECDGPTLGAFLEGLVTTRRGRKEGASAPKPAWSANPSNNDVLKAIRIALELRDDDIVAILKLADVEVSKSEINALFRKKGQDNFRPCGDQFLRNFLVGLTKKYRV